MSQHRQVPVAQLDRASDYESEGWEFESLRARQQFREFVGKIFSKAFTVESLGNN